MHTFVRQVDGVAVSVVMEVKMDVRISIMCVLMDVNPAAPTEHDVQESRSKKDNHEGNYEFETVCHAFRDYNPEGNNE